MKIRMMMAASAMALALGALPASAQSGGPGAMGALPLAVFEAIDSDGDGRISLEEWAAYLEDHRAEMRNERIADRVEAIFEAGDADGDGLLSREELANALTTLRDERMAERRTWRERRSQMRGEQARQMRGHMRAEGQRGRMMGYMASPEDRAERMFQRIDSDDDGFISPEELASAQERWEDRAARFEQRLQRRMERGRGRDGRGRAGND